MQKGKAIGIDRLQGQFPVSYHSVPKGELNIVGTQANFREISRSAASVDELDSEKQIELNSVIKGLKHKNVAASLKRKRSIDSRKLGMHIGSLNMVHAQFRSNNDKTKHKFVAKNKVSVRSQLMDNKLLRVFFRNQTVSLLSLLNRRDDYFSCLRGKRLQGIIPLRPAQVKQVIRGFLESKGKDRGRIKFNHLTNEQMRNIKYKARLFPTSFNRDSKGKDDLQSQEEEEEEEFTDEGTDLNVWKQRNGCGLNQRVFIVKGGYFELRKTLADRGWFQNEDVHSSMFDMKWTTKTIDIDFSKLRSGQVVNHFCNNHHLTSKYGISRRLRTLIVAHAIDIDRFYPRCFDLGDQTDFENFVQNFKFSFVESVAKRFLVQKERYKGLELKIRVVIDVLQRRLLSTSELINSINNGQFPVITADQWAIVTQMPDMDQQQNNVLLQKYREMDAQRYQTYNEIQLVQQQLNKQDTHIKEANNEQQDSQVDTNCKGQPPEDIIFQRMDVLIRVLLNNLGKLDLQLQINGFRNVWIAKPNFLSRGRGIRCLNNLYEIVDYCLGKDCQFVIQKYIENPLLISDKKFDIRQWVLIEDFNPAIIWFYEQCYLRFCGDDYSLDNIKNRFMHLTNNSVQKHNKKIIIADTMWQMKKFAQHIGVDKWHQLQQKIKNIVVWSVKSCEGHVTSRKGSFELVGYDFMIDDHLNPWLIEINMSPSMDYSTPVTRKLVQMVQRDTANLISAPANKKQANAGKYTCICRGDADLAKYHYYSF